MALYTGASLGTLANVTSASDCATHPGPFFQASRGTAYYLAVDGSTNGGTQPPQEGDVSVAVSATNDLFAGATDLYGGLPTSAFDSNYYATKEEGEPDHAGDPGGRSIWYRWTANDSGPVTVDT